MPRTRPPPLARLEPLFGPVIARHGPCRIGARAHSPFEALVCAVAGQQLHDRAVQAILARMRALYPALPFPTPQLLLATEEATLRGCGFSAAKIAAIRGIAQAAQTGALPDRAQADAMDDDSLIAQLTALRGVGRWTVEMLLIFTLGRPDVMPVDDWAVREGWRVLTGAELQPRPRALAERAAAWAPHRSAAAWYLWRVADEAKAAKRAKG